MQSRYKNRSPSNNITQKLFRSPSISNPTVKIYPKMRDHHDRSFPYISKPFLSFKKKVALFSAPLYINSVESLASLIGGACFSSRNDGAGSLHRYWQEGQRCLMFSFFFFSVFFLSFFFLIFFSGFFWADLLYKDFITDQKFAITTYTANGVVRIFSDFFL